MEMVSPLKHMNMVVCKYVLKQPRKKAKGPRKKAKQPCKKAKRSRKKATWSCKKGQNGHIRRTIANKKTKRPCKIEENSPVKSLGMLG